jgi:hypothetical protein
MTPKEKARELRDKMYLKIPAVYDPTGLPHYPIAKEMALIAVDEMTKYIPNIYHNDMVKEKYWQEVKQEIEKL